MSAAQVKNRFKTLSTYLANDSVGQQMLKDLKDAVSVLRKTAAQSQQKAEEANAVKLTATERAKTSAAELRIAQQELRQLRQQLNSKTRRIASLHAELDKDREETHVPFASGSLENDLTFKRIYTWSKKTFHEQGRLSMPIRCPIQRPSGYTLDQILPSFDERGFATLGRTVVLKVLMSGPTCVHLPGPFTSAELIDAMTSLKKADNTKHWSNKSATMFMSVFVNAHDARTDAERLQSKTSGKCNWGDSRHLVDTKSTGNTTAAICGPAPGGDSE